MKELEKMLTREVFNGMDRVGDLTAEEKKKALPVLIFLTLKHNGSAIKGSTAGANGGSQLVWTVK